MNKTQEMEAFIAVVEAGSFVQACESLGISKAAISRYVGNLEDRLGVRLLHRTTRKLSLTSEGEVFYERCKILLSELDEAEAEITSRSGKAVGLIKINTPVTFGILHLAKLWGPFKALHPDVILDVTLSDRVIDIVEEGYDLAIRIAKLPSSTLISRKLSSTRIVLCASPEYLSRAGTPKHPDELKSHEIISYTYFGMGDEWQFQGPDGVVSVTIRPEIRSNNGDVCRACALSGHGIILQPDFLIGQDLKNGTLVELMPEYHSADLGIYAIYPTRKHVSTKVRLLINYLSETLKSYQW